MQSTNQANIDPAAIAHVVNNPPQQIQRVRRISNVPVAVLVNALANPKQRCCGLNRRVLKAGLEHIVLRPQTPPIDPAVKLALKLEKLTLVQLLRRRKQSARRAATAKYILKSLSPESRFRAGVEAEQTHQICVWKQVNAEIGFRTVPRE